MESPENKNAINIQSLNESNHQLDAEKHYLQLFGKKKNLVMV